MNILSVIAASRRRGDPDAADYFARIVSAGSTISANNQSAVNAFIVGCKADGIWTAIKAACFLAGPDDLTGALVPLVGTAPTNVGGNFLSGDYNRTTGLVGNGSTKYLNANRNNNSDPQNNQHLSAWVTQIHSSGVGSYIGASLAITGASHIGYNSTAPETFFRCQSSTSRLASGAASSGFYGVSRATSASFVSRLGGATTTSSITSQVPSSDAISVFARSTSSLTNGRIAFYSIGESLDLAALDARLATYMASIT
jgi:hypothetical protein